MPTYIRTEVIDKYKIVETETGNEVTKYYSSIKLMSP